MNYTYAIYDADPASYLDCVCDDELEADSDAGAMAQVREIMKSAAGGLERCDGYAPGDTLHARIWNDADIIIGTLTLTLTVEDVGADGPGQAGSV